MVEIPRSPCTHSVAGRLRVGIGPWWLWAIPLLAVVGTVPFDGGPRYRVPLDPFLLLLAAAVIRTRRYGRR
jgi:predicted membrane protein